MNAVIIEDETAAVSTLKAILAQNSIIPIEIVAELESIEESVVYFHTAPQPDIIFMDIHLADGSAFKIFEQVEIEAPVVFTTAYDEYALQAFQVSSIDYLLKPVTLTSLERALSKLRLFSPEERLAHIRQTNDVIQGRHVIKSLLIMLTDKFYPLQVKDILYFYTANEKVTAYTSDGKQHPVDRTLDALGDQLDERHFFRANRQYIINVEHVLFLGNYFGGKLIVRLKGYPKTEIQVSKEKAQRLKEWIDR